jgi:hypothetical protein
MRLTWPRLILFVIIELIVILIAKCAVKAQEPAGGYGPQVVMTVLKSENDKKWVIPVGAVWFKLAPLSGPTAKSPLAKGDFLLCRNFDMKDQEGGAHVAVRCGDDVYLIEAFGIKPLEEKK